MKPKPYSTRGSQVKIYSSKYLINNISRWIFLVLDHIHMLSFKTFNRTLAILKPISRPFSQQVVNSTAVKVTESIHQAETVRYPYFVPRNTRGSLPVYSDIRNGGTRYLVILEDVKGDINVCILFVADTYAYY